MKTNASMKSTLRQPLKALLLLLLVGLISFASIARAVEYVIVNYEAGQISRYYKAIGSLVPQNPGNRLMTDELMAILAGSPYIDYEDYRREAPGFIEGIINTDYSGLTSDHSYDLIYNRARTLNPSLLSLSHMAPQTDGVHVSDVYFYAVFESLYVNSGASISGTSVLYFTVDGIEAGYPECVPMGRNAILLYPPSGGVLPFMMRGADNVLAEDGTALNAGLTFGGLVPGERYLIKGYLDRGYYGYTAPPNVVKTLLIAPLTQDGLWYLPAPRGESIDFNAPQLTDLKKDIEQLKMNLSAVQVVSTKDMSAIPMMQEDMQEYHLTAGRWLNREDDTRGKRVCVLHATLAEARGLAVGDTISMTLRDIQSGNFGYISDAMGDTWRDLPTVVEELEIVGLYSNHSRQSVDYTMDALYVYIPDSVMPEGFGGGQPVRVAPRTVTAPGAPERFLSRDSADWHYDGLEPPVVTQLMVAAAEVMYAPNYSFVLKSNDQKPVFLEEYGDALAALGFSVSFSLNNASVFQTAIDPVLWSTGVNAVLFSILLVLALALAVFVYLQQHRREFAIARALGVPQRRAVGHLLAPLALVGGLGILIGGVVSWNYALEKSAQTLASVFELGGVERSGSLSPVWLIVFLAICFALLLAFGWAGAVISARRPVLALLQGGLRARAVRTVAAIPAQAAQASTYPQAEHSPLAYQAVSVWTHSPGAKPPRFMPQARYIARRIRRSPVKSMLVVLVATAFMVSIGWIQNTIENSEREIEHLYNTLEIKAEIVKVNVYHKSENSAPIFQSSVNAVFGTELVANALLVANAPPRDGTILPGETIPPADDDALGQNFSVPPAITFFSADLYSQREGTPYAECKNVISFDRPELFLGDMGLERTQIEYAQGFDESMFSTAWDTENPVILSRSDLEALDEELGGIISFYFYNRRGASTHTSVIAGVYDGDISFSGSSVLMPLSVYTRLQNGTLRYLAAKFVMDPAKNREFAAVRGDILATVSTRADGFTPIRLIIQDEELRQAINPLDKTLSLMTILLPVTIGVVSLIAAGLSLLMVLASAKDVAIMRVLGTTRRKTRWALLSEQAVLCTIGLWAGGCAAALLFGRLSLGVSAIYLAACIVSAIYGAHSVTRSKPLELLQVKE